MSAGSPDESFDAFEPFRDGFLLHSALPAAPSTAVDSSWHHKMDTIAATQRKAVESQNRIAQEQTGLLAHHARVLNDICSAVQSVSVDLSRVSYEQEGSNNEQVCHGRMLQRIIETQASIGFCLQQVVMIMHDTRESQRQTGAVALGPIAQTKETVAAILSEVHSLRREVTRMRRQQRAEAEVVATVAPIIPPPSEAVPPGAPDPVASRNTRGRPRKPSPQPMDPQIEDNRPVGKRLRSSGISVPSGKRINDAAGNDDYADISQ